MTKAALGVVLLTLTLAGCRKDPLGIDDGYCPPQARHEPYAVGCAVIEGSVTGIDGRPLWGTLVTGSVPDSLIGLMSVRGFRTERDGRFRLVARVIGFRTYGNLELTITADPFTTKRQAQRDTTLVIYLTPPGGRYRPFELNWNLDVEAVD